MMNLKILVTGGCGFIGSHLVQKLVKAGHEVAVLDDLSKGRKERLPKDAVFVKGDVADENVVEKVVKGCSAVFHLAAQTEVRVAEANPDLDFRTNFTGSKNVFSAAKTAGAKIIFASSAAVYGNAPLPATEGMKCAPISHYGKNKLKSERLLGNDAFVVRIFNVYGRDGNSVINKFCSSLARGEKLAVFGTGLQSRDYVHVNDVVDAFMLGLTHSGTYNVGTGVEHSVLNIIDMITHVSGSRPDVTFAPAMPGEIERSRADITKIKKELRWTPRVSLEEGIKMLLNQ